MFKLGTDRLPFGAGAALASAATMSRFEHAASSKDIYRSRQALVERFVAGFARPPHYLVLDLDHSEDAAYGQQPLAFYNLHYGSTCYLPLMIFDGQSGALVAAVLPARRPAALRSLLRRHDLPGLLVSFPPASYGTAEIVDSKISDCVATYWAVQKGDSLGTHCRRSLAGDGTSSYNRELTLLGLIYLDHRLS